MLGREYNQGRDDVWHSTPREIDSYLKDWAARMKAAQAASR